MTIVPPLTRGDSVKYNRLLRTGYKVVRLLFDKADKPTGEYEDFMTGFVVCDKQVWGRPVGVVVAQDGSLFVTEDGNRSASNGSLAGKPAWLALGGRLCAHVRTRYAGGVLRLQQRVFDEVLSE
jgi:glucose/arabinose dehydrogenase